VSDSLVCLTRLWSTLSSHQAFHRRNIAEPTAFYVSPETIGFSYYTPPNAKRHIFIIAFAITNYQKGSLEMLQMGAPYHAFPPQNARLDLQQRKRRKSLVPGCRPSQTSMFLSTIINLVQGLYGVIGKTDCGSNVFA
jgi:hypothetical protein